MPHNSFRYGDVFGKSTFSVYAKNLGVRTHVCLSGAALKAMAAGDVRFGRDVVAYSHLLNSTANFDDSACKFMAQCKGWLDAVAAPFVPFPNVQIGSADAGSFNANEYVVRIRYWRL